MDQEASAAGNQDGPFGERHRLAEEHEALRAVLAAIGPAAAPALTGLFQSSKSQLREAAAWLLMDLQPFPEAAVPVLLQAMQDPDRRVREGAGYSLERFFKPTQESGVAEGMAVKPPDAEPYINALVTALHDSEPKVRLMALVVLGRLGTVAKEAFNTVLERAGDEHRVVRHHARQALRQIDAEAAGRAGITPLEDGSLDRPISDVESEERSMGNFTPRAQQVLALARMEADRFNHHFVGTEHLLLGIIKLGQGVAVNVLRKMRLELETVRMEVEKQVGAGHDQKVMGNIPYTPRVKKVLVLAQREARTLNHMYVGTEHILLGLLREGDGVAARVLKSLDIDIELCRQGILKELDPNYAAPEEASPGRATQAAPRLRMVQTDAVDISRRYDIYCHERDRGTVVYRNVQFKGRFKLMSAGSHDLRSEFLKVEQADGQSVHLSIFSIIKFCEHGVSIEGDAAAG